MSTYTYDIYDILPNWVAAYRMFQECQDRDYTGKPFDERLEEQLQARESALHVRFQQPMQLIQLARYVEDTFRLGLKRPIPDRQPPPQEPADMQQHPLFGIPVIPVTDDAAQLDIGRELTIAQMRMMRAMYLPQAEEGA